MADNYLERQYAAYEERKAAMKKPGQKPSTKFYTRVPASEGSSSTNNESSIKDK